MWLGLCLISFAIAAGGYHVYLSSNPHRLLVIVDSSYEMQSMWSRVPKVLKQIGDRPYTEFALATEKKPVHGWASRLDLGRISPYAPRNFSAIDSGDNARLIANADSIVLISNVSKDQVPAAMSVELIRPN